MSQGRTIRVAEFPVRDVATVNALNELAQFQFKYKDLDLLCHCNFRDEVRKNKKGKEQTCTRIETEPFLGDGKRNATKDSDAVSLTPGICSSFAVWPPVRTPAQDLMAVCQNDMLRPQFVFLGMNWSAQLSPAGHGDINAREYLEKLPRWSNWHGASIAPPDKKIGGKDNTRLVEAFGNGNPFRGGYMTDFVKGLVDSNAQSVLRFLRKEALSGCGENPFTIFLDILRKELDALDKVFALTDVPKYLIVFGPAIYDGLQNLARRIVGKSLDELFPDRTVLRTGTFYAFPHGKTREQVIAGTRTLHFPDGEVRTVEEIEADFV